MFWPTLGFHRLSPESRQSRFLTGKPSLTPAEVHYFTEVDHHDHEALVAVDPGYVSASVSLASSGTPKIRKVPRWR